MWRVWRVWRLHLPPTAKVVMRGRRRQKRKSGEGTTIALLQSGQSSWDCLVPAAARHALQREKRIKTMPPPHRPYPRLARLDMACFLHAAAVISPVLLPRPPSRRSHSHHRTQIHRIRRNHCHHCHHCRRVRPARPHARNARNARKSARENARENARESRARRILFGVLCSRCHYHPVRCGRIHCGGIAHP